MNKAFLSKFMMPYSFNHECIQHYIREITLLIKYLAI